MPDRVAEFPVHVALVEALRTDRETLNERFAQRKRAGAKIDEAAFQHHLSTTVNELVAAVATSHEERVRAVVQALFDVSLDLFAAGLLGPQMKHPFVVAAWREVLPQATTLLVRDPARIAGCLSNAVDHLAGFASARPREWIDAMCQVSPSCESVSQWLNAGKVLAWRAGLVQYRTPALRIAREMPWNLAARCLSAETELTESEFRQQMDRMEADRWYSPLSPSAVAAPELRMVRMTGGFRGFGGPCLRPPTVRAGDGDLFVSDGQASYRLLADVFGTFWQSVPSAPDQTASSAHSKVFLDARGMVTWDGTSKIFAELADSSSFACDGQTLAVTLSTSHLVFLMTRTTACEK